MNSRIRKKLIALGLMGTLLFSGTLPAMAINPSFEVQNTAETTQAPKPVTNSSYAFEYEVNYQGHMHNNN